MTAVSSLRKLGSIIAPIAMTLTAFGSEPDMAGRGEVPSPIAMRPEVRAYYLHEQRAALVFAGIGALSAIGGVLLVMGPSSFSRGLGWSWVVAGAIEVVVGSSYALSAGHRAQALEERFERDDGDVVREERAAARETTERFPLYLAIELAIALAGVAVAAYGAASNHPTWKGVGFGIVAHGLLMFAFDIVSWRHSVAYAVRFGAPGDSA